MPLELRQPIFGPAGFPLEGPSGPKAMSFLASKGLFAMEYQAVRSVRISKKVAKELKAAAEESGVTLSIHGPYAINLSSEQKSKIRASKSRLLKTAVIGNLMGAFHVTFHPGYYGKRTKKETFEVQLASLKDVLEMLNQKGLKVELGPETTGKESQFGSLDELLELSSKLPEITVTVDFAHIHVREEKSKIKGEDDYRRLLDKLEKILGKEKMDSLLVHFTEVEPTSKGSGERKHHPLGSGYGPDFKPLAKIIAENGYKFVIISESPILEKDSIKMKEIYIKFSNKAYSPTVK
ncbi:MAG: TIM barrel protein [Thermoproteota archaeon]|nr:TIM barrel protein [Candidatus Brockarchaeota archaeon]MBO3768481.1 TIM barrel protein [Candidatus Brockarchaeota archaeon]